MKRLRWLLLVAIVAVAFVHYRSHAAPSAREVESALRVYLSSPESQNCSGSMTLEQLDEVRVGEYAEQFGGWPVRSEEHTSELQSQFHLVCRLLLEKKKTKDDR